MAYFAKKEGLQHYRKAKTQRECECFICGEIIRKGEIRYAAGRYLSLCVKCADCWEKEGGMLGNISRKNKIIY